jgi:hypothetical protein
LRFDGEFTTTLLPTALYSHAPAGAAACAQSFPTYHRSGLGFTACVLMKGADGNQMGNYDDSPFPIPARSEGLIMCRQVILLIVGTRRGSFVSSRLRGNDDHGEVSMCVPFP